MNMHTTELHTEIDLLITEYISGNLSQDSFEKLRQWSLKSEENRCYVRHKLELWFSSGMADNSISYDKEEAYARFLQKIHTKENQKTVHKKYILSPLFYKVAIIALIIILPLAGYWSGKETIKNEFTDIVIEAPLGSRTRLYLPDGTSVWLNAGSCISYSQGFGMEDRKLNLKGEGYFEVEKDPKMPFQIYTPEVSLQVLGTKFNFRNYPDDKEVTVSLIEGSVALHNEIKKMNDLQLNPDERMTLDKETGEMHKSKFKVENTRLWTKDELFFDEDLLEDIAKRLMRSYNIQIEVEDSLKDKRFYGSFKITGNTIEEVLETLASTGQMHYKIKNGKYILY